MSKCRKEKGRQIKRAENKKDGKQKGPKKLTENGQWTFACALFDPLTIFDSFLRFPFYYGI